MKTKTKSIDLNQFTRERDDAYHEKRSQYLSSHQLITFRRCPYLLRKEQLGLVARPDRRAFAFGRAAHTLILEGEAAFDSTYLVSDGPINPKTSEPFWPTAKVYQSWLNQQHRRVVSTSDALVLAAMAISVRMHEHAAELLSQGEPELVLRTDYLGVPSQIRCDWLNDSEDAALVDLKTARTLDTFEADLWRYAYPTQLAFYRSVVAIGTGRLLPVYVIAVEKEEPHRCGVWRIAERILDREQAQNEAAIHEYRACLESNVWPTGYEQMREIT